MAEAGEIVAIVGLSGVEIGDTISDALVPRALPRVEVDEPTLQMVFSINSSPLAGQEGKYVTSRNLRDRLLKELERNVALRVEPITGTDAFEVSGRGLLHLSVLIEIMRREGYELSVGKPQVILHEHDGIKEEPFESLVIEVPHDRLGPVMEMVGARRGQMVEMNNRGEYSHVAFSIPARGLIGLRTRLMNATQGMAIMHHRFEAYRPVEGEIAGRAERGAGVDGAWQGRGFGAGRPARPCRPVRRPWRSGVRRDDRRREQPGGRHVGQPDQGKEAHQHAGHRQRPEHPAQAAALDDAGSGARIYRRGRAGRGHADQDPAAKNAADGKRP